MCDAQSDQSLFLSLEYSMSVKLHVLTEHHLEFQSLMEAAQARLSLHLSKCHIVGKSHVMAQLFPILFHIVLHVICKPLSGNPCFLHQEDS